MKTVAGIDLGTQSMKVVLYDYETRKSLESSSCPMELISESDGTREQKTEWYKKGLEVCFSKISSDLQMKDYQNSNKIFEQPLQDSYNLLADLPNKPEFLLCQAFLLALQKGCLYNSYKNQYNS